MKQSAREAQLSELRSLHAVRREAIQTRLEEFRRVSPSEYFYELAYCLLTPQSSAANAGRVISELRRRSFREVPFDPTEVLRDRTMYIRFHATKSRHLLRLASEFDAIVPVLTEGRNAMELREWLVENVRGFGYKEATHFLRNIGQNGGLAILDRHILRNLRRYGVIRSLPPSLTRNQYLRTEQKFMEFAEKIGIPVDELDLLFWSMETGEILK